jgi:hypothetical protein
MAVGPNDISFVLSGGSANIDPDLSLGGDPSAQPIVMSVLFDDLTEAETAAGHTDYRCFYLTNDNASDALYSTKVFIESEVDGGATVQMGVFSRNERQQIVISNYSSLNGGDFVLRYESTDITIAFNSTPASFAAVLQTELETIGDFTQGVLVSANVSGASIIFEIDFAGNSGNRYHPILQEVSNNLTPLTMANISISKLVDGSPINAIADEIDADTTPPTGVVFGYPTEVSPISIGTLYGLDVVPIWIKRTIVADTEAVEDDGMTIRVKGEPIPV